MVGIPANHGYLKGVVFKELAAGRKCEITGGVFIHIDNMDDYRRKKTQLVGEFGEVISRKANGTALIATRSAPEWAERMIDREIWNCEEMLRWEVPEEER